MKQLIKITENNGKQAVSARELHLFLEIETRFDTWVSRMMEYGFIENIDCSKLSVENQLVDWALTIECAKHWAMMQRTQKGMEARNYFIECERKLKELNGLPDFNDPVIAARAWADQVEARRIAEAKNKILTAENTEMKPKAFVHDRIVLATNLKSVGEVARLLGTGQNRFFEWLRNELILKDNNEPYQKYLDPKYFEVKVSNIPNKNMNYSQTFFTAKGLNWITKRYNGFNGTLTFKTK